MKQKQNARDRRDAMKKRWKAPAPSRPVPPAQPAPRTPRRHLTPEEKEEQARIEAEETRLFLEYIGKTTVPQKEETVPMRKRTKASIPAINLEEGMPVVEEAVRRMSLGIQEMKVSGIKVLKLIHGYGSTGTGGKIRISVRDELENMKKRKLIRDYIPGEDFGPFGERSRRLTESDRTITKDPDYGRGNHGVTIVWIVL